MPQRVYIDNSVIGGLFDDEFFVVTITPAIKYR